MNYNKNTLLNEMKRMLYLSEGERENFQENLYRDKYKKDSKKQKGIDIQKLIKESISEVLSEATSEEWSKHYQARYTGEEAQKQMSKEDINEVESLIEKVAQGDLEFKKMTNWLNNENQKYYYAIDRMVEEYQKTGNENFYTWVLSFYSTNSRIKQFYKSIISKYTEGIDPTDVESWIDEGIMEKLEMSMKKFDPNKAGKSNFHAYTLKPQRSHILSFVQQKIQKKYGEDSLDAEFGGDEEGGGQSIKDKIAAPEETPDDSFDYEGKVKELKMKLYDQLKNEGGVGLANAYHDFYIEGARNWGSLVDHTSEWDRYELRGSGKATLLKYILVPQLEKAGFAPEEMRKDFKVKKISGKLLGMPNNHLEDYKEAAYQDNVLKGIFDFIVYDKDIDLSNPSVAPIGYIVNPSTNARTRGILGDIEAKIRSAKKVKIVNKAKRLEIENPGISKILLSNPLKGTSRKAAKHVKGMDF